MSDALTLEVDQELLSGFVDEALESLAEMDSLLVQLESTPGDLEIVNAIFRPMHSIKGNAPFFGLTNLRNLAHALEDLLALVREGKLAVSKSLTGILLEGADEVTQILKRAEQGQQEVVNRERFEDLLKRVQAQKDGGDPDEIWKSVLEVGTELYSCLEGKQLATFESLWKLLAKLTPESLEPAEQGAQREVESSIEESERVEEQLSTTSETKVEASKTMRISEEHIDTFLSFVGELLILGEMLSYLERRVSQLSEASDISNEFKRINENYSSVSQNLQSSLMSVRKVAVKGALQKVPRLVRDIASTSEKEIRVKVSGEGVEVDKSLIELIDAPLTHMVRNAADHGIEAPQVREELGKSPEGLIQVSVTENDTHIVLQVTDDGAGLNHQRIQAKAEELGIVDAGVELTQEQIVDFLFCAGVSTAEQVTDVSGRGVGMDVVKKTIESAGGSISVQSTAGKGSTFTVNLVKSVTTTIIEGLVFCVGTQYFVLPTDRVNEIFFTRDGQRFNATGEDDYFVRQNRIMPIVPAHEILSVHGAGEKRGSPDVIVSLTANGKEIGLLVDTVLSVQQVVVKEVKHLAVDGNVYTGGALIGDGQIALILDVDRFCSGYDLPNLADRSHVLKSARDSLSHDQNNTLEDELEGSKETFIVAELGEERQAAIPLSAVSRLEKVQPSSIERANGMPVIQYRGTLLPLFDLSKHFVKESKESKDELDVIVWQDGGGQVGLIVDSILDIVEDRVRFEELGRVDGIAGTVVLKEKVTDVLEVEGLLRHAAPSMLSLSDHSN